MKLTTFLGVPAAILGLATAAPITESDIAQSNSSKCGYVRFTDENTLISGLLPSSKCTPFNPTNQEMVARFYRLDRNDCVCKFYTSKESCERRDDVPSYAGPTKPDFWEKSFEGEKPSWGLCAHI
ncbi:hypothetical protein CC80DRAFT_504899 [Byssothecium circinans]|uniref:Uncharacterized protein n=1 Tax=Byssothecium circinans TaxID=147558 RepID=A0A6A5TUM2_9PLEO|nr:hypothetical protein CC80DRAFT_504899 [Byssothecium circinans]